MSEPWRTVGILVFVFAVGALIATGVDSDSPLTGVARVLMVGAAVGLGLVAFGRLRQPR